MENNSNWDFDKKVEEEVLKFIEENFLKNKNEVTNYKIVTDKETQNKGIDVFITTANGMFNNSAVDIKIASTYVNRNLPTFAFEISSLRKPYLDDNDCVPGWFIDKTKKTEFYLIGWIWADVPIKEYNKQGYPVYDWTKITKDNIIKIEVYFIRVQDIKDYLEKKKWTDERIIRQDEKIRKNGRTESEDWIDNIKFTITIKEGRPEKPINIVIRKPVLKKIATYVKEIRKEG